MCTGTFMNIVASKYKDIKSLFKSRLYKMDIQFNEDVEDAFNDTFIKCVNKFNNEIITYEITIKYFWTAFINTLKSNIIKNTVICIESLDTEIHDCIDDTYNELYDDNYSKELYNTIMNAITVKFGENDMNIYCLYKYHGWTKNDLIAAGYECINLETRIKKIHRFVKTYNKKNNKKFIK